MHTWKEFSLDHPFLFIFLYLGLPKYVIILKAGHHLLNSISQLMMILVGTITRWGPHTPLERARWARNAMVWIVLPRPISSANIPFIFLLWRVYIQCIPNSWYSLSGCLISRGCLIILSCYSPSYVIGLQCKLIMIGGNTTLETSNPLNLTSSIPYSIRLIFVET